ncbi:histidine phosphatase superfamily [Crucibulum laeve]|uniref:Histidine phosphatase superfamily n=1 Tax=Crucibulum laeve TaxID=68775 RepID=A0A5C3LPG2_9AGAR|nr:histidine phosphatase superfamily [Crucibulum laeve]
MGYINRREFYSGALSTFTLYPTSHIDMITVTFIRHGESEDNLKAIWAGWKDAPLSELGRSQAQALAESFASVPITHIYASPLKRAHSTGLAVHTHQPEPKPTFTSNPHLREQHFGIAEGNPWVINRPANKTLEELYAEGIYPVLRQRHEKFPEGESLDDLARRCEEGVQQCVLAHLHEGDGTHVALASHGLCISELVAALLRLDPESNRDVSYAGLLNTAWTRVTVRPRNDHEGPVDPHNPPPLEVKVTHVNVREHLNSLAPAAVDAVEEEDEAKAEARAFFGGGSSKSASTTNAEVVAGSE